MEPISPTSALAKMLDASNRPIYAVDSRCEIVYCNAALANWIGLEPLTIVGRRVEYHSDSIEIGAGDSRAAGSPLTDLCPPPRTFAGQACVGAVGCVARDGRLVHRRAEYLPVGAAADVGSSSTALGQSKKNGVLVILATADMRAEEVSAQLSDEPADDELHRAIRRFRRNQATEYAVETLLGNSPAMRKLRAQVAAAATSEASVLIRGRRGSGRAHVARAIHYNSSNPGLLSRIDCAATSEDGLRRAVDSLRNSTPAKNSSTLVLLHLERMPPAQQAHLLNELASPLPRLRIVSTIEGRRNGSANDETSAAEANVEPKLLSAMSTITIDVPSLAERLDDLPLLSQFFLEAANRGAGNQVGSVRADALELLALYSWPGELDELRSVIVAAHAACQSHEITPADLPVVIHHAAKAAALPRRFVEKIVLEDLLAEIEREVVTRALNRAGGNKSAAADLLGMTRPRLYRRLVQLGLATDSTPDESQ